MTLAFWDSSGFLKLLIEEPGRDLAVDVWNDASDVVASRLAVPEVSEHKLSAADAVHLSSVLSLADTDPVVVTWDRCLGSAASAVGLPVVPEPA